MKYVPEVNDTVRILSIPFNGAHGQVMKVDRPRIGKGNILVEILDGGSKGLKMLFWPEELTKVELA